MSSQERGVRCSNEGEQALAADAADAAAVVTTAPLEEELAHALKRAASKEAAAEVEN